MVLTPGQASDCKQFETLMADHAPEEVVADTAYDSNANRALATARGSQAAIKSNPARKEEIGHDKHVYRERSVVEMFWAKVKTFRRVATRDEKKANNFLGFFWLAALSVMMK